MAVYIFGVFDNGYTQCPNDSTSEIFKGICSYSKAKTQIVIHRDDNLMYYCYIRKLDKKRYVGFCYVFTGLYVTKIDILFSLFENVIEILANKGEIVHYAEDGKLTTSLKYFYKNSEDVALLSKKLESSFNALSQSTKRLPPIDFSVAKGSTMSFSINDPNSEIVKASYTFSNTFIYKDKDYNTVQINSYKGVLSRINNENIALRKKNQDLKDENAKILRQKKQFKNVIFLILAIIGCGVSIYFLYDNLNRTQHQLTKVNKNLTAKTKQLNKANQEIKSRDSTISGLQILYSNLHSDLETITSYSVSIGATIRNTDSHDDGWILWLNAKQTVCIESFYIKGKTSGSVDIGLFDTDDKLIASYETNALSGKFQKVNVGSEWTIESGTYYMKIRSGVSLQYHSSDDIEYNQFSGGALEVTGASGYGDRSNLDSRNKHSYYQYFYNIQYHIVTD